MEKSEFVSQAGQRTFFGNHSDCAEDGHPTASHRLWEITVCYYSAVENTAKFYFNLKDKF